MKKPNYWVTAEVEPGDWDSSDHKSYPYGFTRPNKARVQRLKKGDYILRYWKGHHTFVGMLKVVKTFDPKASPKKGSRFPWKVKCVCLVTLGKADAVSIHDIKHQFTFYGRIKKSPRTLGNYLMPSPRDWQRTDGKKVAKAIQKASSGSTPEP